MRRAICLLLFPISGLASPLVPPPGFTRELPQTVKGKCVTLPAPFTGTLQFRSKYEGSGPARATLNPQAEAAYQSATKPIADFERGIMTMVWRYKQSGDPRTLACILAGYSTWANAGALQSTDTNHTGRSMRKWALATLATGWLELKFLPGHPLANHHASAETERWLGLLADQVVTDWDGLPLSKTNNHSYWAAWSVMATSVALNRRDLFDWSLKEYRIAASQIDPDGSLPNEKKRGSRALAYHHYALEPLVMMASFAHANRVDLMQENEGALARLAGYVLKRDTADAEWLEPYCSLTQCARPTLARRDAHRPLKNRRLGGDLTVVYGP